MAHYVLWSVAIVVLSALSDCIGGCPACVCAGFVRDGPTVILVRRGLRLVGGGGALVLVR